MERQNTSVIQKLSISYECALAIGRSLNLSEMLHDVIHTIVHKTNAHRGSIWLREEKEGDNIKLEARAGSLLTDAEIKKRVSSFKDIFEKIWKNQLPVIKNRDDKDFFQYCFIITGKEQSVLIVPIKNVAILKLVYTNKEVVNEILANILLSLSEKLSIAINACLAHDNIKKEIQIRKDTEDLLKHSEQQYRSTIDSISKAIHVVDENLSILLFNKTFKQWNKELGFETGNLIGRNIFDIFPFLPDAVREEYQKVFKTGKMLITIETNELAGKKITTETRKIPILENNKVVRVVTVIDDITERKRAEESLQKEKEYYHSFVESLTDWVWEMDMNGLHTYSNSAVEDILGYKKDEVVGHCVTELWVDKAKTPETLKWLQKTLADGKGWKNFLGKFKHKNGSIIITESTAVPIFDSENKLIGYRGIDHNITKRKLAEEELEQSEEKYHTLVDNIQDGVFIIKDAKMQFVNEAFARMVGYTVEETIGMDFRQLIAPEDIELVADRYRRRQAGEEVPGEYEFRMLHKDGVTRVIVHMNVGLVNYQGKLASMGTVKDITKQKQAEDELKKKTDQIISHQKELEKLYGESEVSRKSLLSILEDVSEKEKALRESEERFQNIVANTGDWIWETDTDGRYTYSSPVVKQVLGYEYQEMLDKHFYDLALPEEQDKFKKTAFERSEKEEKVKNLVSLNVHKDGHIVFLETSAVPLLDDKGNLLGYRGVTRDITERKRAEQTQSVLYNIADAVNTTKDLDELFHLIQSYLSTILDTTNFFIALYNKETDTIFLAYDVDQKDKFVSFPAGKTLTAYVIKTGKSLLATKKVMKEMTQAGEVEVIGTPSKIWLGIPLKIENEVTGVVAVQSYTDASLYTEKDLAILEFVSDSIAIAIAHMRADNALENSEEKYRLLFEETPVGILTCDINGIIQSINNTALQLLGSPSEEATKQINLLTFPPLKEIGFSDDLKHCMNEGREISSEKLYTSKWGKSVFFHYKIIPTLNQEGKITGALCTLEDITEQKRAEEIQSTIYKISDAINTTATLDELYQTIHQHLSTVIDTTNFYIALYDEEKEFISFPYFVDEKDNQPAPRKLRKGLTEYVMRTDKAIFVTEESLYKLEEKGEVELLGSSSALWLGIPLRIEKKIIGVMTVQSYTDSSLYNEKDLAILEFVSDQVAIAIDRKKKGEQIKKDLEEKIVMLMEIHHRVKNNMQVISSMLKMQSGYIRDEQDRQLFKDSLNRVKSMALIHEKLYQTEDLANIDFSEYINSLAIHLFSTFGIDKFDIQLDTKVRDVFLDINTAIPCGLIINELISNSLKYAFPHGEKGKITVNFIWKEDTEFHDGKIYTLVVKDNGVGFPADIDFRNTESLGLQLVNTLVEQLHGNIKLNGKEGTSFEIIFKRVKLKKRSRFY